MTETELFNMTLQIKISLRVLILYVVYVLLYRPCQVLYVVGSVGRVMLWFQPLEDLNKARGVNFCSFSGLFFCRELQGSTYSAPNPNLPTPLIFCPINFVLSTAPDKTQACLCFVASCGIVYSSLLYFPLPFLKFVWSFTLVFQSA